MRSVFFILIFVTLANAGFAAYQLADTVYYRGEKFALYSYPLESYFKKFPEKRPVSTVSQSILLRGYVAVFEIVDGQLFVRDVLKINDTLGVRTEDISFVSVWDKIFPDQQRVKVEWFSGVLVLPFGEEVKEFDFATGSFKKRFRHQVTVENGDVKKEEKGRGGGDISQARDFWWFERRLDAISIQTDSGITQT